MKEQIKEVAAKETQSKKVRESCLVAVKRYEIRMKKGGEKYATFCKSIAY